MSHLKDLLTDLDECIQWEEHKFWKTWMMWFHQSHSGRQHHQKKKAPQPMVSCLKKEPNGIVDCARPRSSRNQSKHGQYCYCIQYILDILIIWPLKWRNTCHLLTRVSGCQWTTTHFFLSCLIDSQQLCFHFFLSHLLSFAWLIFTLVSVKSTSPLLNKDNNQAKTWSYWSFSFFKLEGYFIATLLFFMQTVRLPLFQMVCFSLAHQHVHIIL